MRWIYISPHLDDSVLSAGGLIYEQSRAGLAVEIWTIVCGFPPPGELTPFAQLLHSQWGTSSAEETVRIRRAEDVKAASILGAKTLHFDVPDCIYRRAPDGEPLYQDIFVEPREAEAGLPDLMAQAIAARLQPDDQVACQFAIGGHVDHVLVRQAAERLGRPLSYLADLPYLFNQPGELALKAAGMNVASHPITEAGLGAWVEAILAYESQLSTLFDSPGKMEEAVRSYSQEWNGIPVWSDPTKVDLASPFEL
ncbi:MAG: PIG-L deacetylase family protein [Chloroflexota bacterium]